MTKDDIIRMAREACDKDKVEAWGNGFWTLTQEELERFASLVAAAEREACAKACDEEYAACWNASAMSQAKQAQRCAEAIRARGTK